MATVQNQTLQYPRYRTRRAAGLLYIRMTRDYEVYHETIA